jgi:hypothetical protein
MAEKILLSASKTAITQWESGWLKVQEVILPNHVFGFLVR